jgi:hypothetical protein
MLRSFSRALVVIGWMTGFILMLFGVADGVLGEYERGTYHLVSAFMLLSLETT